MKMKWTIVVVLIMVAGPCLAKDRLELDATEIQGARELPKVLYIVPWKKTSPDNKPVRLNSMVDELMTPVDRDVLKRQLQFYKHRESGAVVPAAATGQMPPAAKTSAMKK